MKYDGDSVADIRIAYIGGGSRRWAWGLMSDLAQEKHLCGSVFLYDIDFDAAKCNEMIGNRIIEQHPGSSPWTYRAVERIDQALTHADFVIISILPGTFNEMASDVHTPEKYSIYQSVGDSVGAGGLIRALRTIPMYEVIANAIKAYCPDAWVINYTNPMTICVRTLYKVFPNIKAFGCCHEVFGTQKLLAKALVEETGLTDIRRNDIKVNVTGINHFTWIDKAYYRNVNLFPIYDKYARSHYYHDQLPVDNANSEQSRIFNSADKVKFDLYLRYGLIAAAGDRHLAEFCPNSWYLRNCDAWNFSKTPVSYRKNEMIERLERSRRLFSGEEVFQLRETGEEGIRQMKAILGLGDFVTNVNVPNQGQISNLPIGSVVETNASFTANQVAPVMAGELPANVLSLVIQAVLNQEMIVDAGIKRDLDLAFTAFAKDPQVCDLTLSDARNLFDEMVDNTAKYLTEYR